MAVELWITQVGWVTVAFDRIRIASPVRVRELRSRLPMAALEAAAHDFRIFPFEKRESPFKSAIEFTCTPDMAVVDLLRQHEDSFRAPGEWGGAVQDYLVTQVEVAIDRPRSATIDSDGMVDWLGKNVRKTRHSRGWSYLYSGGRQDEPPDGCSDSTIYLEERKSTHATKSYIRRMKLTKGRLGEGWINRLEFTLKRRALKRHIGNKLGDLTQKKLFSYVMKNVRFEEADWVGLARHLYPGVKDDKQAMRGMHHFLRTAGYASGQLERLCSHAVPLTTAQLRGAINTKRRERAQPKRGRPSKKAKRANPLAERKIAPYFKRRRLRVRLEEAPRL